ncbi:type II toxin-antitoxin system Phd/YefM family antitoxin [Marispirochaeta sp.]|uniref:type II toxin-antitoxin system Phd/YefM family antitoxin n=1 Tax=Marispirochaeta sp. TaxID=2038653 RepID=UPI0029C9B1E6|nr:type II toxin-antitoxin system Phd/YefM family antitoxin [Marispirochaeta sp.]
MPQIIPIKELRNTTEISRICHENDEPIFVTKNGYGDMVLMSMETYERKMARAELFSKIAEGEEDVRKGNFIASDSVFKSLRKEFFETEV